MGGPRHVPEDKIGIGDHRIEYPEKRQTTMYGTKHGAGSLKPGGRQTVLAGVLFRNNEALPPKPVEKGETLSCADGCAAV